MKMCACKSCGKWSEAKENRCIILNEVIDPEKCFARMTAEKDRAIEEDIALKKALLNGNYKKIPKALTRSSGE